jgi:hypothetical protein
VDSNVRYLQPTMCGDLNQWSWRDNFRRLTGFKALFGPVPLLLSGGVMGFSAAVSAILPTIGGDCYTFLTTRASVPSSASSHALGSNFSLRIVKYSRVPKYCTPCAGPITSLRG